MFSHIWNLFQTHHNKIIQFFRGFIFTCAILISALLLWSNYYGVPEEKIQYWISGMVVIFGIFCVAIILKSFISYLSPEVRNQDEYIISGKSLLDIVDEHQATLSPEEKLQEYVEFKTQFIASDVHSAIRQQEKKSVVNLVVGIVFSLAGAGALLYLVQYSTFAPKDMLDFASNFLPRLSLILLIETFAYFFLRLYKDNLREIKYWQNELTAIQHRILSLNLSLKRNDEALVKEISLIFSKFENNRVLLESGSDIHLSTEYLAKIIRTLK